MQNSIKALVLTYKTAPVSVREQISLNETGAKKLLNFLREYSTATDILTVSTCNRTEIYYCSEKEISADIFQGLKLIKNVEEGFGQHFTAWRDRKLFSIFLKSVSAWMPR